ncbi:GNAT family N-acetyltransferase [Streptomyces sp. M600PL45_2]|uniref:GNAT family N-acetyltransferase n=2 Tax=Streptomyces marispadix TaxID=2922868 RepID=A0ABS9SS12_9ACTN|nr:GNAT family N-acetyltransferase [Streptomyces marispadix]
MTTVHIRAGAERDLRRVQEIERAAGGLFRELGMDRVADDSPPPIPVLRRYVHNGGLWVAEEHGPYETAAERPVAYVLAEPLDGNVHIEQVSVDPGSSRKGIGRALIDHVAARAAAAGVPALTLCTFERVPWNAPYYKRCGFRVLAGDELTPGLRRIRAEEAHVGLDRWPRVCMRRELAA